MELHYRKINIINWKPFKMSFNLSWIQWWSETKMHTCKSKFELELQVDEWNLFILLCWKYWCSRLSSVTIQWVHKNFQMESRLVIELHVLYVVWMGHHEFTHLAEWNSGFLTLLPTCSVLSCLISSLDHFGFLLLILTYCLIRAVNKGYNP